MGNIFIILIILLGAVGYLLMIRDIKKPDFKSEKLIGRPYYWFLLFYIGGLTTISIGVLDGIFHFATNSKWLTLLVGSALMVAYILTLLFLPRKYFISKYKKK